MRGQSKITNQRIININNDKVTFIAKDLQFEKHDLDAIIKQQKKPETTIERFKGLPVLIHAFARMKKKKLNASLRYP